MAFGQIFLISNFLMLLGAYAVTVGNYGNDLMTIYAKYCGPHALCNPKIVNFPISTNITETYHDLCPKCFCDVTCMEYGDCCPDVSLNASKSNRYECVSDFLVISKCKVEGSDNTPLTDTKSRCEDWQLYQDDPDAQIPVSSRESGVSYRNIDCARCNKDVLDTKQWLTEMECKEETDFSKFMSIKDIMAAKRCKVQGYRPPRGNFTDITRRCSAIKHSSPDSYFNTCNRTGQWKQENSAVKLACNSYNNPISVAGNVYKNIFCLHCNVALDAIDSGKALNTGFEQRKLPQPTDLSVTMESTNFSNGTTDYVTKPAKDTTTSEFRSKKLNKNLGKLDFKAAEEISSTNTNTQTNASAADTQTNENIADTRTNASIANIWTNASIADTRTNASIAVIWTNASIADTRTNVSIADIWTNVSIADTRTNDSIADTPTNASIADTRTNASTAVIWTNASIADTRTNASIAHTRTNASIADTQTNVSIADIWTNASIADTRTNASIADTRMNASIADTQTNAGIADTRMNASIADTQTNASIADIWTNASIPETRTNASIADTRTDASIVNTRRNISTDTRTNASIVDTWTNASIANTRTNVSIVDTWTNASIDPYLSISSSTTTEMVSKIKGNVIASCNVTGSMSSLDPEIAWGCKNMIDFREMPRGNKYRNSFCALCNGVDPMSVTGRVRAKVSFTAHGYQYMFDFMVSNDQERTKPIDENCPDGSFYDSHKNGCREIYCSSGRTLRGKHCIPLIRSGTAHRYSFVNKYIMAGDDVYTKMDWNKMSRRLVDTIGTTLNDVTTDVQVAKSLSEISVIYCINKRVRALIQQHLPHVEHECLHESCGVMALVKVNISVYSPAIAVREHVENALISLLHQAFKVQFSNATFSAVPVTKSFSTIRALLEEEIAEERLRAPEKCVRKQKDRYILKRLPQKFQTSNFAFTTVHKLLACPQVELKGPEFKYQDPSRNILEITATKDTLLYDEYTATSNESVMICLASYNLMGEKTSIEAKQSNSPLLTFLSCACTAISLLCLFLTFVTYSIHSKLRTLPGKNNMCLVCTLALAQFFLFIGVDQTESRDACVTFGILTHYFWLAAFCSMNVCSFHMFRVFSRKILNLSDLNESQVFFYYLNYIFCVPIFILTVTIVTNLIVTSGKSIGYAGKVCFLSSPENVGYFFVLPVVLMVILNLIFFGIAAYRIRRSPNVRRASDSRQSHDFWVYLKLFTITGITWCLQILASQFTIEALSFASVIINGGQGVFIFLAFVCNKRVLRMYRQQATGTFISRSLTSNRSGTACQTSTNQTSRSTGNAKKKMSGINTTP